MQLLAGPTGEDEDGGDSGETTDSASVGSTSQAGQPGTVSTQVKMDVSVELGEVALFVSGRCAEVWWPAEVRRHGGPHLSAMLALLP